MVLVSLMCRVNYTRQFMQSLLYFMFRKNKMQKLLYFMFRKNKIATVIYYKIACEIIKAAIGESPFHNSTYGSFVKKNLFI